LNKDNASIFDDFGGRNCEKRIKTVVLGQDFDIIAELKGLVA